MVSVMHWCFDTPKAESLRYVTSPIQKEKIKTVVLLILTSLLKATVWNGSNTDT